MNLSYPDAMFAAYASEGSVTVHLGWGLENRKEVTPLFPKAFKRHGRYSDLPPSLRSFPSAMPTVA